MPATSLQELWFWPLLGRFSRESEGKRTEKEINTVNSKKDAKEIELNQKEQDSYDLIRSLVDDKNLISKYTLEGHLLYGDLKLTNFRMYHIILSLQNKGLLKTITKDDGEYYLLVE